MGKSRDFIKPVIDRPGHDRRYAIDSSKIRRELGWGTDGVGLAGRTGANDSMVCRASAVVAADQKRRLPRILQRAIFTLTSVEFGLTPVRKSYRQRNENNQLIINNILPINRSFHSFL